MFELDIVDRIYKVESQLFQDGYLKKNLGVSEIAYLYSLLEELARDLSTQYNNRTERN